MNHLRSAALAVFILLAGIGAAAAAGLPLEDAQKLHDYTLSMTKIHALGAALADFQVAAKKDPSLAKEANQDDSSDDKTLAQTEAEFAKHPRIAAFYKKHGLTADDAVLMPLALMSASIAVQYPQSAAKLADQTSPQQIAFVKAHQDELKKVGWLYNTNGGN